MMKKITDVITIVFPAIVAILGVFGLVGFEAIALNIQSSLLIALGAISTIASLWYNKLEADEKAEKK
jgi:hypothetical protein